MRSSFFLLLVVVAFISCSNAFVNAKESAQARIRESDAVAANSDSTHQYLRGGKTITGAGAATTNAEDEERISFPGGDKVKTLLQKVPGLKGLIQKNPALSKGLQKPGLTKRLSAFFKENPAIKKELIVAAVLLTLIIGTPVVVNSFY